MLSSQAAVNDVGSSSTIFSYRFLTVLQSITFSSAVVGDADGEGAASSEELEVQPLIKINDPIAADRNNCVRSLRLLFMVLLVSLIANLESLQHVEFY